MSPPANPPPGRLCPASSRYSEKMISEWKISRVTTSKMMERRSGARVRPATIQASRAEAANLRLMASAAPSRDDGSPPAAVPRALGNGADARSRRRGRGRRSGWRRRWRPGEHGDLAERVPGPDVHEGHVDDVQSAAALVGEPREFQ